MISSLQILITKTNPRSEYGKPVLVTEYGGDTVAGLHTLPSLMFTEEWQAEMLRAYWAVFDTLRPEPWLVELIT